MKNKAEVHGLKLKLASYGSLRAQAWTKILAALAYTDLKMEESFNRKAGSIAYVVQGVLKEYDSYQRKKPSIINFIGADSFILTTKYTESKYVKAGIPSKVVYLEFDQLMKLFLKYGELKTIYDHAAATYEDGSAFRQLILEENSVTQKIQLFINKNRLILPSLKKKDICNYLDAEYDYFIRLYSKLL